MHPEITSPKTKNRACFSPPQVYGPPHQMKLFPFLSLFAALVSLAFGQTEQNQADLDNAEVLDEVVHQHGKDTLVIQRIEQPEFLQEERAHEKGGEPQTEVPAEQVVLPSQTYIISATFHGRGATRLQIWPSHRGQQGALEGWSNIDWAVFQSLLSFDDENVRYQFMLFHSGSGQGVNAPEIPNELPEFDETGARYLVTSSEETEREETLDFLEAIHTLYDGNQAKLHADRAIAIERQEERQRQIAIEKETPKTRVLKIWRHTRPDTEASD